MFKAFEFLSYYYWELNQKSCQTFSYPTAFFFNKDCFFNYFDTQTFNDPKVCPPQAD